VRYVVVDEYQDTNPIQEKLIERLSRFGANLCVVGDDDQTIYQWRGSAVANILSFVERKAGVQTVTLDENFRSSKGIVALGRDVAALNDPDRLSKNMVAAGHQSYERGDMLALAFDSAADKAAWICDRIARLRGTPFIDSAGAEPRGLSWSDFAVLFRAVPEDADALVAELRRRSIPYVIKGLSRLFDAPEVQASVACFRYILQEVSADDVVDAWVVTDVGVSRASLAAALPILEEAQDWQQSERWGTYNIQRTYLQFLEALGIREETVPSFGNDAGSTTRGELVFYNLGVQAPVSARLQPADPRGPWLRQGGEYPEGQPAAPPSSLVLDVRGLRASRPMQESPVIVIDRFIEPCYAEGSFGSPGRGRGRT
jgi:DNA helicase-2/ATP-dependent DNA helicase PcrA